MFLRFPDEDRERWNLPEWVDYSPSDITIADLEDLSERFDFELAEWPDVYFGQIPFEAAGQEDAKPVAPKWQARAALWMALHQGGAQVSWEDAGTVRLGRCQSRQDAPGKEPETDETLSDPSDASTTPPSESSSA